MVLNSAVMKLNELCTSFFEKVDYKFTSHFGFAFKDVSFNRIVEYMYSPRDSASLAVTRILFGLAMLFDIPEERGGAMMDVIWGDERDCRFPLLPVLQAIPMPYMAIVYAAMWLGALGIMLGYKYRLSASTFAACYWYLFLIEKGYWNNHSYLFGLVSLLLIGTDANCYWSIDSYIDVSKRSTTVPYWNYFVLKYQFFLLYFVAGLKKGTAEWLTGYSLPNLAEHWVFTPFKFFLTEPQIDYLIVHWFAFVFDLTIAFWMMWSRTRHVAMVFCAAFHLMNIRLFKIGMFPWVCLATMPLFYPFDWPKLVYKQCREFIASFTKTSTIIKTDSEDEKPDKVSGQIINGDTQELEYNNGMNKSNSAISSNDATPKRKLSVSLIIFYMCLQAFLPYSHFLTKGYNNWTEGLYGYSWDMMVHSWDVSSIVVKAVDNNSSKEYYIKPFLWTPNDRWVRHGDMVHQYAQCVQRNFAESLNLQQNMPINRERNISVYVDVWCSLNGRFHQRMFDPKVDLITASWSPFDDIEWLMPLLTEATNLRGALDEIRSDVYSWNNYSDVVFLADFPGYHLENYLKREMTNVSLIILSGKVAFETNAKVYDKSYILHASERILIASGEFHRVTNIGEVPSYYMYTYANKTLMGIPEVAKETTTKHKLRVIAEFTKKFRNMFNFFKVLMTSLFKLFFRLSMSLLM